MDRKLARKNLQTAYIGGIVAIVVFFLTFVAAILYIG